MRSLTDHGHIRALDGIRGFAFLLVFAFHALTFAILPVSALSRFLQRAAMMGWVGVDLFFVLSGFLITRILLDARAAENYFQVFYIRRALRIFPLYYLVLIGALVFIPVHYSAKAQIFYWLNLSNLPTAFRFFIIPCLAHFWSLAIEEQFYLVWPSVVRLVKMRTLANVCMAVIAGLFLVRNFPQVLAWNQRWPEFVYRLTPFRVDTLCAGALLAVAVSLVPDLERFRWYMRLVCLLAGCAFVRMAYGHSYGTPSVIRFGYTSLLFCFACLVALALSPESVTSRVFSFRPLRETGRYSYALYLSHRFLIDPVATRFPEMHARLVSAGLVRLSMNAMVLAVAGLEFLLLFGLCALSWRFFEAPILGLKRHFRYKPAPEHSLA